MLQSYARSLREAIDLFAQSHLEREGVREEVERLKAKFTVEGVMSQARRYSLYGLCQFVLLLPVFTFGTDQLVKVPVQEDAPVPREYERRLRETMLEFQAMGVMTEEFLP